MIPTACAVRYSLSPLRAERGDPVSELAGEIACPTLRRHECRRGTMSAQCHLVFATAGFEGKLEGGPLGGPLVRAGRPRPAVASAISASCKRQQADGGVGRGPGGPPSSLESLLHMTSPHCLMGTNSDPSFAEVRS